MHRYANDTRVTYTHWPIEKYVDAQSPAYRHHLKHHPKSRFEFQGDIDEYPFMPNDLEPGFLLRFARNMSVQQTLIRTWFFAGPAETNHTWRAMRYFHKQEKPIKGGRVKPLYVPSKVEDVAVHGASGPLLSTKEANPEVIHLKHYWCERLEEKQPVFDDSMKPLIEKVIAWEQTQKKEAEASKGLLNMSTPDVAKTTGP